MGAVFLFFLKIVLLHFFKTIWGYNLQTKGYRKHTETHHSGGIWANALMATVAMRAEMMNEAMNTEKIPFAFLKLPLPHILYAIIGTPPHLDTSHHSKQI